MRRARPSRDGVVRSMWVDSQEEEANERHPKRSDGQQHQEVARVSGEEDAAEQGEEESAEAEGGQGKCGGGSSMVWPVQRRCLDRRGECHAASEAGEVGEEAHQRHRARPALVGSFEREVPQPEQDGARQDSRPGAFVINKHANRHTQGIHAQVPRQPDQIALRRSKV